jgi:hypothetical protein
MGIKVSWTNASTGEQPYPGRVNMGIAKSHKK